MHVYNRATLKRVGEMRRVSSENSCQEHSHQGRERDKQLVELLAVNLHMYFELLMLTYADKLNLFVSLHYDRQYSEDIVQETFVKAYQALSKYSSNQILQLNLRPWLYTIARNLYLNHSQRYERVDVVSADMLEAQGFFEEVEDELHTSPERELEWKESYEKLHTCIRRLSEPLRLPVLLHYICELEYQEVAKMLNLPLNTVKSNGRRGFYKLCTLMKEDG